MTDSGDALLARVQDLLLRSPSCGRTAVEQLTELQSAVHDLDQHLLAGGRLPSRWCDGRYLREH